jgi:hypothetical protein
MRLRQSSILIGRPPQPSGPAFVPGRAPGRRSRPNLVCAESAHLPDDRLSEPVGACQAVLVLLGVGVACVRGRPPVRDDWRNWSGEVLVVVSWLVCGVV